MTNEPLYPVDINGRRIEGSSVYVFTREELLSLEEKIRQVKPAGSGPRGADTVVDRSPQVLLTPGDHIITINQIREDLRTEYPQFADWERFEKYSGTFHTILRRASKGKYARDHYLQEGRTLLIEKAKNDHPELFTSLLTAPASPRPPQRTSNQEKVLSLARVVLALPEHEQVKEWPRLAVTRLPGKKEGGTAEVLQEVSYHLQGKGHNNSSLIWRRSLGKNAAIGPDKTRNAIDTCLRNLRHMLDIADSPR